MGFFLRTIGRYDEAERYSREAVEKSRRVLGEEHPSTLVNVANLGRSLAEIRKNDEAITLPEAVEAATRETFTDDNAFLVARLLTAPGRARAGLKYDAERFAVAEANLLEAHKLYVDTRGTDHRETLESVRGLIDLYTAWDAVEPGKGYDAKAAEWRGKLPKEESSDDE